MPPDLPSEPSIWLLDTNILLRLQQNTSPHYQAVVDSIAYLLKRGDKLTVCSQNLIEFWVVATRPVDKNGMGFSPELASANVRSLLSAFALVPDTDTVFLTWLDLCEKAGVQGKQAHDTRLVALMQSAGIPCILTINDSDFRRFVPLTGIQVISPLDILAILVTSGVQM